VARVLRIAPWNVAQSEPCKWSFLVVWVAITRDHSRYLRIPSSFAIFRVHSIEIIV
jgi:hypothetical protein